MPLPALITAGGSIAPVVESLLVQVAASAAAAGAIDMIGDSVAGYFGPETAEEIPSTAPGQLIANIEFRPHINVTQENKDNLVGASNVISQTQADTLALLSKLTADAEATNAELSTKMSSYDAVQAKAAQKVARGQADPKIATPPAADKKIKGLQRRPTDRVYVSQEYHEWTHNTSPLKRVGVNGPMPITLWADAGDGQVTSVPSFGEWIDAVDFRKAGELYRKLVRASKTRGGKALLAAAGTTQAQVLADLIAVPANKLVFTDAITNTPFLAPD